MIKSRVVMAGALLAVAGAASAEVSVTPAIVSDYDFRGISQTAEDPGFQLGLNWAQESGFYAGAWASNVDFGGSKPDIEVDVFAGFSGGDSEASVGYDVGIMTYNYPGAASANYTEIYAGISKSYFSGKVWFAPNVSGTTAWYTEVNGKFPLPYELAATAHAGYSYGNYWDNTEYFDWSVGVERSFGPIDAYVKYVDGSDLPDGGFKTFSTDAKVVVGISTTLPWGK